MDELVPGQVDMKPFRQMYLVVSVLPTVLLLLTFVLWFMFNNSEPATTPIEPVPTLQYVIFGALALASLPLAIWTRGLTLRQTGDLTTRPSRYSMTTVTLTGDAAAIARITSAATIGMAMPEISVLLGFVLAFMTESWTPYLPFAAYTVLGWIIMYPRPEQVRRWFAQQTGAVSPDASLPQPL